jgi:DNA segregation ATPase FtsK/SpoIIIE-like protein
MTPDDLQPQPTEKTLDAITQQLGEILARQGIGRQVSGGRLVPRFSRRIYNGGSYFLLELDTGASSIPGKVSAEKLKKMDHTLTALSGLRVRSLNTHGITYAVQTDNERDRPLPDRMRLDFRKRPPRGKYRIPIGYNHKQGHLWLSLLGTSHILVGGESRSGKSTFLNALLAGLLPYHSPQELNVVFVDPKAVEFNIWDGIPHQIAPIAETAETALPILNALVDEMQERRIRFKAARVKSLSQYNATATELLPLIVVVLDELTDLTEEDRQLYRPLTRLASKGAAFGILLVVATQNPNFEVVPTVIRSNLSTRLGFRVANAAVSRTILGENVDGRGCHQVPRTKRGRFVLRYDAELVEMQGFYISDEMAIQIADQLRRSDTRAPRLALVQTAPESEERSGNNQVSPQEALVLTDEQWHVLQIAIDDLDGELSINRLFDEIKCQDVDISRHRLIEFGQQLETLGWVTAGEGSNGRRCTDALIEQVARHFEGNGTQKGKALSQFPETVLEWNETLGTVHE